MMFLNRICVFSYLSCMTLAKTHMYAVHIHTVALKGSSAAHCYFVALLHILPSLLNHSNQSPSKGLFYDSSTCFQHESLVCGLHFQSICAYLQCIFVLLIGCIHTLTSNYEGCFEILSYETFTFIYEWHPLVSCNFIFLNTHTHN